MYKIILTILLFVSGINALPVEGYMFRVQLKNKGQSSFTIDKPQDFLSKRSIERRLRQNISIDSLDLPISSQYISDIENLGFTVVAKSKWMSTLSVYCKDSVDIDKIRDLKFVDGVKFVWKNDSTNAEKEKKAPTLKKTRTLKNSLTEYGYALDQIKTVNGDCLHEKGYKGKGIEIAVIDAGFTNFNEILLLDNVSIKGIKDFVYDGGDIFQSSDHGVKVLSVMATNRPGTYVGVAPDSKYWLLRSEDSRSEYPIEEDYWITAAEYADSVGIDIINTSLGYYKFDFPAKSYTQEQLNGKTAQISKAANIATQKGIFVEVSAGNEGEKDWRKIVVPADVENVLSVGSMTQDSLVSDFSSRGLTADGRIKPDVVALGTKINVIASTGEIDQSNGTSFAGPIMSGLAACLWEAYPNLTNIELLDIIRKSADKYNNPDNSFGYGIPNMGKAMKIANDQTSSIDDQLVNEEDDFEIYPVDSTGTLRVKNNGSVLAYNINVFSVNGKMVLNDKSDQNIQDYSIPQLVGQVCIVRIIGKNITLSRKIKL